MKPCCSATTALPHSALDASARPLDALGPGGGRSAAVQVSVLLLLCPWMSLTNPFAFLAASLAGAAVRSQSQCMRLPNAAPSRDPGTGVHTHDAECPHLEPSGPLQCQVTTRSILSLITPASLKQAVTTHTCSLVINARSALFETVGLPAQS